MGLEEWHPSPNERHLATAAQPLIIVYNCTDHAARADAYCRAEASVFLRGAISGSEPSEGSSSLELSSDLLSSEPEPVMNETLAQELRNGRGFLIGDTGVCADGCPFGQRRTTAHTDIGQEQTRTDR